MYLTHLLFAVATCLPVQAVVPEVPICTLPFRLGKNGPHAELRLIDHDSPEHQPDQQVEVWLTSPKRHLLQAFPMGEHIWPEYLDYLFLADVNLDGAMDIIASTGSGTGGDSYDVWLYEPHKHRFTRSPEYSAAFQGIRSFTVGKDLHISAGYQAGCSESFYRPLRDRPVLTRWLSAGKDDEDHSRVRVLLHPGTGPAIRYEYVVPIGDHDAEYRWPCEEPEDTFRRAREASSQAPGK